MLLLAASLLNPWEVAGSLKASLTRLCPANKEMRCLEICPMLQIRTILHMWNWCATCCFCPLASLLSLFFQIFGSAEVLLSCSWCLHPLFWCENLSMQRGTEQRCPLWVVRLDTRNKYLVLKLRTSRAQNIFVRWYLKNPYLRCQKHYSLPLSFSFLLQALGKRNE